MQLYGLVELELQEAIELFPTREEAEDALAAALRDVPEWKAVLAVVPIELVGLSWN